MRIRSVVRLAGGTPCWPVMYGNTLIVTLPCNVQYMPSFGETIYFLEISEDEEVGRIIETFTATDPDPGLQGQITYSLSVELTTSVLTLPTEGCLPHGL